MSTSKVTMEWYRQNADRYAEHVSNPIDSIYHSYYEKPAMRTELPDVVGKSVLSLGCGSGIENQYLKEQGAAKSVGIDITTELIEIAKREHPKCEFHVMDMERLKFGDNTFDLVYSSLVIHYLIGGPHKALKEAFRVLKPGGTFLFSDGHPLGTSMEVVVDSESKFEKKLGIVYDRSIQIEEDYGNYLTSRVMQPEEGWVVEYWHQPLSLTINQIIEAGFILDKVVEFEPVAEMQKLNPRIYERLKRIPEMLLFKAHKP